MLFSGLFSASGRFNRLLTYRGNEKIASRAIKFVKSLKKNFKEYVGDVDGAELVYDFLKRCLDLNPQNRPSPKDLLSHPLIMESSN